MVVSAAPARSQVTSDPLLRKDVGVTSTADSSLIGPARFPEDLDGVRSLFVEYAGSLGFSLAYQNFDAELAALPGQFAPPTGAMLLARAGAVATGVIALRRLEADVCEMKRLYVRPRYRGQRTAEGLSLGRALATGIVAEARRLGYRRMRLDTVPAIMAAAMKLYMSMGFVEIAPYYPSPLPGTAYLELNLLDQLPR